MGKDIIRNKRNLIKSRWPELKREESDRKQGVPLPPMQKNLEPGARLIDLPDPDELTRAFGQELSLSDAIGRRQSHRKYSREALKLQELAYLLWASQGVRKKSSKATFRTVPSGGARQPFETYLFVQRVEELERGLYRYLPLDHQLAFLRPEGDFSAPLEELLDEALLQHNFGAAVSFIWTAIPYRSEWAFDTEAARLILLDAGHLCQNLYLSCEAVSCGTCAVGAFDQEKVDQLLRVDGEEEFCIYAAPVGKKPNTEC